MDNLIILVNWFEEYGSDTNNNGYNYGIYVMNVTVEQYKLDAIEHDSGYGDYEVLEALWYITEEERDDNFKRM